MEKTRRSLSLSRVGAGDPGAGRALGWVFGVMLGSGLVVAPVQAKPNGPVRFCEAYPASPDCMGRFTTCSTCHTSTEPPMWNAYGAALLTELAGEDFDAGISAAMARIEDADADADGETNLDEILVGTNPGNAESIWQPVPDVEGDNPWYALGSHDPRVAYRRVMTSYCGYSPRYEQRRGFEALAPEDQRAALHEALATCLDGEYWRGVGLRELADRRIRPIFAVGAETRIDLFGKRLVLADYDWDYRLWRYILSDDRDIRGLLTATYHVEEDGAGGLAPMEGPIAASGFYDGSGGQPLAPEHRAGMITTQWFLMSNTMLSALPRTTAAQAYRAYLGMELSLNEGIVPIAGEPLDIDEKGVAAAGCAQCHSTLDPLSYAFSYYRGLEFEDTGKYDPTRPAERIPNWDPEQQKSMLLGQPVSSVVEWGQVASESIYFRQAMVRMFFEHALGYALGPGEYDDLSAVVATVAEDGHSANRIIHRIVDTAAFGAP